MVGLKLLDTAGLEHALGWRNAVGQWRAEFALADLERVARLGFDAVGERQRRGAEEMNVHVARAQELGCI